jgi:hypothetical protein
MPELLKSIHPLGPEDHGVADRSVLALLNQDKLRRILTRMLDEREFLSHYGIRALSRYHLDQPFVFSFQGKEFRVQYLPAESDSGLFGGNSNWRGPIWFPVNSLIIRALLVFHTYYGDNFKIECPTGSGNLLNLFEVAREIGNRLSAIFLRDGQGRRPVYGGPKNSRPTPTGGIIFCFTNTSMATTAPGWGPPTKSAGPGWWPKSFSFSVRWMPRRFSPLAV